MAKKTPFTADCDKYWRVTTNKKTTSYGETRSLGVIARSSGDVCKRVSVEYPDEVIVSISHVGPVDITPLEEQAK